VSIVKVAGK